MKPYVVYIGQSQYDEYYKMDEFPRKGAKTFVKMMPTILGGMIANAACISAHYGLKTYLLDTLNYSEMSKWMIEEMTDLYGLDMSKIFRDEHTSDSKCIILLHGDDRTILVTENDRPDMIIDEDHSLLLNNAAYIYSGGDAIERLSPLKKTINDARSHGTKIFLDLDSFNVKENMEWVIDRAQIISVNEHGFSKFCGNMSADDTVAKFFEKELETLIVTKGSEGCDAYTRSGVISVPGIKIDVVDTTGAGDTFNSSFVYATIKGYDLENALKFASCAASSACLKVGARSGATTESEVRKLMEQWF